MTRTAGGGEAVRVEVHIKKKALKSRLAADHGFSIHATAHPKGGDYPCVTGFQKKRAKEKKGWKYIANRFWRKGEPSIRLTHRLTETVGRGEMSP